MSDITYYKWDFKVVNHTSEIYTLSQGIVNIIFSIILAPSTLYFIYIVAIIILKVQLKLGKWILLFTIWVALSSLLRFIYFLMDIWFCVSDYFYFLFRETPTYINSISILCYTFFLCDAFLKNEKLTNNDFRTKI